MIDISTTKEDSTHSCPRCLILCSQDDQDFIDAIFVTGNFRSFCDDALPWMPQDFTDDMPTLVRVMAWCRQATRHNLNICLPRSMSTYGVTRLREVCWKIYDLCRDKVLSTTLNSIERTYMPSTKNRVRLSYICVHFQNVQPMRNALYRNAGQQRTLPQYKGDKTEGIRYTPDYLINLS